MAHPPKSPTANPPDGSPGPAQGRAASAAVERDDSRTNVALPESPTLLPGAYRGKASGEFKRVQESSAHRATPSLEALLSQAQVWLERLPAEHEHRRVLQLGVLRRDPTLLAGVIQVLQSAGSR